MKIESLKLKNFSGYKEEIEMFKTQTFNPNLK